MIYIEGVSVTDTDKPTVLYSNILKDGTLTGDADAAYPLVNAISVSTWDFWKTPSATAGYIVVTLASQTTADCCFIDAHDMATVGADFRIERSTDGGTIWLPVTDWITPADNSPIMVLFDSAAGNTWRIGQRNGPATIGVIMLGEKLAFEYGIEDPTSFRHGVRVEVLGGDTLGGHHNPSMVVRRGGETSFSFPWLTSSWVNTTMDPFEAHYNDGKAFGMALRPGYDANEVAYCWRPDGGSELRPSYQQNGRAMSMNMRVSYYVAA